MRGRPPGKKPWMTRGGAAGWGGGTERGEGVMRSSISQEMARSAAITPKTSLFRSKVNNSASVTGYQGDSSTPQWYYSS